MNGQTSAMIAASVYFAEDLKKDFSGEIFVAGVVYESIFEGVVARKISEAVKSNYVVIGESSELNLKIGQRGRAEIVVETLDRLANSANPEKVINAVYVNKNEKNLLVESKTNVIHNPESNMGNAVGVSPAIDLISKGITVRIGTDAYISDMFESMKVANII